jgi:hypothetical protein
MDNYVQMMLCLEHEIQSILTDDAANEIDIVTKTAKEPARFRPGEGVSSVTPSQPHPAIPSGGCMTPVHKDPERRMNWDELG